MESIFNKYKLSKKGTIFLIIVLAIPLALRMALPTILENYVNNSLSKLENYRGEIGDIDVALFRGAYRVDHLTLQKASGEDYLPFLEAKAVDISVEWRALFEGGLVGEVILDEPLLNLVSSEKKGEEGQLGSDESWVDVVKSLLPITLNRFEVINGTLTFRGSWDETFPEVAAKELNVVAEDISNLSEGKDDILPSSLNAKALLLDGTPAILKGRFDLLKSPMDVDLEFECEMIDLTYLNPLLRRYVNLDVKKGDLGIYSEWAILDSEVQGYLKFVGEDVDVFQLNEKMKNPIAALWEALAEFIVFISENKKEDQFAAKIPFEGNLGNMDAKLLPTIGSILKNGFVKAMTRDVEDTINIEDLDEQR